METIETLGTFLDAKAKRDAVHIALLPVVSSEEWLSAGYPIRIVYGTENEVKSVPSRISQGVVDPFLTHIIKKGDRFWMFLNPGTIQGLRHEWHQPEIDNRIVPVNESEDWLRRFADKWNFNYNEMISAAASPHEDEYGNYITAQGKDLHSRAELGKDYELFWYHIQRLTAKTFDEEHKQKLSWSCSC